MVLEQQSEHTYLLESKAGVKSNNLAYATIHPSRILLSEQLVM